MKQGTSMCEGSIAKTIIAFAIPLFLGNLFQQLYNTVDSIIVGNWIGSEALAAVGSSGAIINLLLGFCIGASAGAGVVVSQFFGAGNREGVGTVDQTQGLGNDLGKNLGAHNGIHGQRHIAQGVEDGGGDQTAEHEHHEERAEDAQPDGPAEADNEGPAENEGGSGDQHIMQRSAGRRTARPAYIPRRPERTRSRGQHL